MYFLYWIKKSPQWDYMQQYRKNIIPALSFRHILYLLCADLLISPDGRHHAYAWKPIAKPCDPNTQQTEIIFSAAWCFGSQKR